MIPKWRPWHINFKLFENYKNINRWLLKRRILFYPVWKVYNNEIWKEKEGTHLNQINIYLNREYKHNHIGENSTLDFITAEGEA